MRVSRPVTVRFNEKVVRGDGCWEWLGTKDQDGYGLFKINVHKCIGAHRFAWQLATGRDPKGVLVCHSCDNAGCVNPDHLWIGTAADNNRDRDLKGRTAKGERHHNFGRGKPFQYKIRFPHRPPVRSGEKNGRAKITEEQVRAIRSDPRSAPQLALELGMSSGNICQIRRRQIWAHVE